MVKSIIVGPMLGPSFILLILLIHEISKAGPCPELLCSGYGVGASHPQTVGLNKETKVLW